ncbi:MAG: 3-deoxy-7-phosphoheptulonate synthase, partial [Candidatus Dormibacteraeota bacterium]|nr:3-deoxy-7-phosphoheptulonate synthase [Candidatus Dormibacteraeota bacterium]
MLILMHRQATREDVANVVAHVRERGYQPVELPGTDRLAIGVLGSNPSRIRDAVAALPGVVEAIPVSKPFKQVAREWHPEPTVVTVGGVRFGGGPAFVVVAGPCAVESREQMVQTAEAVAAAGAS